MEHGGAVEADLQRYYQTPLSDLFEGRMTWRRLHVLLTHLPRDAATVRVRDPEGWDLTDHLLAGIHDLLAAANWQRSGDKRIPRPKPLPRPGVKNPGEKRFGTASLSISEMRERLDRKNRGGARGCRTGDRVHQPGSVREGDGAEARGGAERPA